MKIIIVFTYILTLVLGCKSHPSALNQPSYDNSIYHSAYSIIVKDVKSKSIYVYDSLIFIPRINFSSHFKNEKERDNEVSYRIDSLDLQLLNKPNEPFELNFKRPKNAEFILYFSKITEHDYFFAEIIHLNHSKNFSYLEQAQFSEATQYFFRVDKNGNLIKVDKVNLYYD